MQDVEQTADSTGTPWPWLVGQEDVEKHSCNQAGYKGKKERICCRQVS